MNSMLLSVLGKDMKGSLERKKYECMMENNAKVLMLLKNKCLTHIFHCLSCYGLYVCVYSSFCEEVFYWFFWLGCECNYSLINKGFSELELVTWRFDKSGNTCAIYH